MSDNLCDFKYLCNNGSWIQCFWLCKKAIDKMLLLSFPSILLF